MEELLASFTVHAPGPLERETRERMVDPLEPALSGFVFKIQANMDPAHRDRIAFLRLCSGKYTRGMRLYHVRLGKEVRVADALTFMASDRAAAEEAFAGDIIDRDVALGHVERAVAALHVHAGLDAFRLGGRAPAGGAGVDLAGHLAERASREPLPFIQRWRPALSPSFGITMTSLPTQP